MTLSVIIVNWNTVELLRSCLTSLLNEVKSISHEIIVVDNASTDNSQDMVKRDFPEVTLVENKHNIGFPRANNQVLSICTGEFILLLNPDTVVCQESIISMIMFLQANDSYGAVGPKISRPDGSIQQECACSFPTLWNMFCELTRFSSMFKRSRIFGRWRLTYWDHRDSRDVECLLGAAILTRRSLINQIGFLDEYMYIEDVDFCYRVKQAGFKTRYLASAEIIHYDGAGRKSSRKYYHHYQIAWHGLWYFFRKHHGRLTALTFRVMTLICSLVGLIFFSAVSYSIFFNRNISNSLKDKSNKARATLMWSLTPPRNFEASY